MSLSRRHKSYLKALGVEVWVPRGAAPSVEAPARPEPDAARREPLSATVSGPQARSRSPEERVEPPREAPLATEVRREPGTELPPPIQMPSDWDGLRALVKDCQRCKLCATRTQTVFGVGREDAPLMVVGEGPGADEDAQGEPFVGKAGKLLDEMLAAIGRSRRENVYIANVVKCRPPGNRDPEVDEAEACRPFLEQQIRLVKPRLIVGLGRVAAQRLLTTDQPLARLRGPLHRYGPEQTPLFITYHPAYLLRSPREKSKSWEDLKKVWRFLEETRA